MEDPSMRYAGQFEHVAKMSRLYNSGVGVTAIPPVRFRPTLNPQGDISSLPPMSTPLTLSDTSEPKTKVSKDEVPPVKIKMQSGSVQQSENETDNDTMGRDLGNAQSLSNDVNIDEKESDLQDTYNTEKLDDIGQTEDSTQSQGSSDRGSLKSGNTTNSDSSGKPTSMPPGGSNKVTAVDNNPELTLSQVAAHLAVYEAPVVNKPPVARSRSSSITTTDLSELDVKVEREKLRNKQRQRELEKETELQEAPSDTTERRKAREERKKEKRERKERRKKRKEQEKALREAKDTQESELSTDLPSSSPEMKRDERKSASKKTDRHKESMESEDKTKVPVGRNMRASARSRTPSEASSAVSRKSNPREKALLEQLHQQQRLAQQQDQARRMAQDLINQAYLQDESLSRQRMVKERAHAKKLLDEAFPLAQSGHQSAPNSPAPGSIASGHEASNSVQTEPPTGQHGRHASSLEKLLADGSLTKVHGPVAAWEQPEMYPQNLSSIERRALLRAIREELHTMQPPNT